MSRSWPGNCVYQFLFAYLLSIRNGISPTVVVVGVDTIFIDESLGSSISRGIEAERTRSLVEVASQQKVNEVRIKVGESNSASSTGAAQYGMAAATSFMRTFEVVMVVKMKKIVHWTNHKPLRYQLQGSRTAGHATSDNFAG